MNDILTIVMSAAILFAIAWAIRHALNNDLRPKGKTIFRNRLD